MQTENSTTTIQSIATNDLAYNDWKITFNDLANRIFKQFNYRVKVICWKDLESKKDIIYIAHADLKVMLLTSMEITHWICRQFNYRYVKSCILKGTMVIKYINLEEYTAICDKMREKNQPIAEKIHPDMRQKKTKSQRNATVPTQEKYDTGENTENMTQIVQGRTASKDDTEEKMQEIDMNNDLSSEELNKDDQEKYVKSDQVSHLAKIYLHPYVKEEGDRLYFIVTDEEHRKRNHYKIGFVKTLKSLINYYYSKTGIEPTILYARSTTNHINIDTEISKKVFKYKCKTTGTRTKWVQLDFTKLVEIINEVIGRIGDKTTSNTNMATITKSMAKTDDAEEIVSKNTRGESLKIIKRNSLKVIGAGRKFQNHQKRKYQNHQKRKYKITKRENTKITKRESTKITMEKVPKSPIEKVPKSPKEEVPKSPIEEVPKSPIEKVPKSPKRKYQNHQRKSQKTRIYHK